MRLLAIGRDRAYSPGQHADNDRLILDATADRLRQKGHDVAFAEEDDVGKVALHADAIVSMCQGRASNQILESYASSGALIVNSPVAVQNCHRARLHRVLAGDFALFAPGRIIDVTLAPQPLLGAHGAWLKRGDVHSTQSGDVVRVQDSKAYFETISTFHTRGIKEAILEDHVPGQVVKFYGVLDSDFFRFYGERETEWRPASFANWRSAIESMVRRLGLEIYGGDAVITNAGDVVVIDINDWPSFAPFRAEAAVAIASHIHRRCLDEVVFNRPSESAELPTQI
jgi:hypothetical protein